MFRTLNRSLELLQTIDDHAAAVGDILFSEDGSHLFSISSDRTVIIRKLVRDDVQAMAYLCVKVITLKSSPVCFGLMLAEEALMVSTLDRQIQKFDFRSGRLLSSFKATDPSTNDTILITSLDSQNFGAGSEARVLLFGASSSDRVVQVHDCANGRLLFREQAQASLSSVTCLQQRDSNCVKTMLVSCGNDGTVFTWDVNILDPGAEGSGTLDGLLKQTPAPTPVKRRTLTRAEISRFQKSLEGELDTTTQRRSPSPLRIYRRPSRQSTLDNQRTNAAPLPNLNGVNSLGETTSTLESPSSRIRTGMNPRRPCLDPRRRSKSAVNLNDLSDTAEQLCSSLRTFRERYASSVSEKLNKASATNLENELNLALKVIAGNHDTGCSAGGEVAGDALDVYFAKLIDERLALKTRPGPSSSDDPDLSHNDNEADEKMAGLQRSRTLETLMET